MPVVKSRPVEARIADAIAEISNQGPTRTRRIGAMQALVEMWDDRQPDGESWDAISALLELDHEALKYDLSPVEDLHGQAVVLLSGLSQVIAGRSEGSVRWADMYVVKDAIEMLSRAFAALEECLVEIEVES